MSRRRRSRHARPDQSATGNVLTMALELGDLIWLVLTFAVRLPVVLLRLLV
ncbi:MULTISPECIES: hypothetical protein [unclassified Brachybacterium]|uniref:hypothetical protein n=1 Tax=unclassified Brachybacterium TaxID=2623841 RepID=UPI003F900CEF